MTKKDLGRNECKTARRIVVILLSLMMVMGGVASVFAETKKDGEGGAAFAGADDNTFARGMDLQEVYLDIGATDVATSLTILEGDKIQASGLEITLSGDYFSGKDDTTFGDQKWEYVYEGKAIFPDGTTGDVHVEFTLQSITARSANNYEKFPATVTLSKYDSNGSGIDITSDITDMAGAGKIAFKYFTDVKVYVTLGTVIYDSGTFILPISGFNQFKGAGGAWAPFASLDQVYRAESFTTTADTYVTNDFSLATATTGEYYPNPSIAGGNNNYDTGFAIEGDGSTVIAIGETGAKDGTNGTQKNDVFIRLGDLQHRIWSGSGPNGKIETSKDGTTGTGLAGGSFTGNIPSGCVDGPDDLKRYVVPDAKENVKYTMTPDAGYFAKEVCVDGELKKIPMDQPAGTTWTFAAGTLTHVGGDKYEFVFTEPNDADHSIYVTWRTTPAADDATSIDGKGQTQKGTPTFKPGAGETFEAGAFTLIDDNGDPVDSITVPNEGTYTINKDTGEVTFVPEPDFVGPAKGVTVRGTQTDGQTASATYTPTVVETEETKTISRDITFTYLTEDGETASTTVTQTLTFKRTGTYNKATGKVDYPDWEPQTFPEVKAPEIEGWTPNMAVAPALAVTGPDEVVEDVHIVYDEKPAPKTIWVTYIDPDGTVYQGKQTVTKAGEGETQEEPAAPKDPTKDGYTFGGWDRVVDADGNITYIAKWTPKEEPKPVNPAPSTGDNSNMSLWILIMLSSMLLLALYTRVRMGRRK